MGKRAMTEYAGGHATLPAANDVVSEFADRYKETPMYVAVSLQSIKKSEIVNVTNAAYGGQANTSPSLTMKIADFFRKINLKAAKSRSFLPFAPVNLLFSLSAPL